MAWVFKADHARWFKDVASLEPSEELNASTFQTYMYLVKVGRPVGPRDVMRGANLSSPSVAYRNLQKLMDLGLVVKDEYNNYVVKEKVSKRGYVWVGKTLMPSFIIIGFIFVGMLIAEVGVLVPHLIVGAPIEEAFWFWIVTTIVAASLFLVEAIRFRMKPKD
jgi:hypothetical protein